MIPVAIVPVLARHDVLDRMLESIDHPVDVLLIIDNDSQSTYTPPPNELIERTYHLKMPNNLGVAASWNLGIKSTPHAAYWAVVNFDVVFAPGQLAAFDAVSAGDRLVLSAAQAPWCAFTIGETIVERVGLFDESLYPAYFEDNDMERRCARANVPVVRSDINVAHANSTTLSCGYKAANARTYQDNAAHYLDKCSRHDYSSGEWSLARRRRNEWKRENDGN